MDEPIETRAHWTTRDSGERQQYESGMQRDTNTGKPRFDLMIPNGIPYADQMLTRFAELLARGAEKYNDRNWEKANSDEELARFKESAFRHLMQWLCGETDEDHAAAVMYNLLAHESTKAKMPPEESLVQKVDRILRQGFVSHNHAPRVGCESWETLT